MAEGTATTPAAPQGNILPANHVAISADDYASFKAALAENTSLNTQLSESATKYKNALDKLNKANTELTEQLTAANASITKNKINTELNNALPFLTDLGREHVQLKLGSTLKLNDEGKVVNDKGEGLDDIAKAIQADDNYKPFLKTKAGTGTNPAPQNAPVANDTPTDGKSIKLDAFDKLTPAQKTQLFTATPGLQIVQ